MSSAVVDEGTDVANHFLAVTPLKILHRGRARCHTVKTLGKVLIRIKCCR
jgi:hypothetical protein